MSRRSRVIECCRNLTESSDQRAVILHRFSLVNRFPAGNYFHVFLGKLFAWHFAIAALPVLLKVMSKAVTGFRRYSNTIVIVAVNRIPAPCITEAGALPVRGTLWGTNRAAKRTPDY